jgi:hypothetical protein
MLRAKRGLRSGGYSARGRRTGTCRTRQSADRRFFVRGDGLPIRIPRSGGSEGKTLVPTMLRRGTGSASTGEFTAWPSFRGPTIPISQSGRSGPGTGTRRPRVCTATRRR